MTKQTNSDEAEKTHIHNLKSMGRISKTLGQLLDIEEMLQQTVKVIFEIFNCDRAWLLYPCEPDAASYRIPFEHTRAEYPGAFDLKMEIPITEIAKDVFNKALANNGPVTFKFESDDFLPDDAGAEAIKPLLIQSQMVTAVYPKIGKPWLLGLHQCSYPRTWTPEEQILLHDIASRIANTLTEKLLYQHLQESEKRTSSLLKLSQNLEQARTYSEILQAAHQVVQSNLDFQNIWIYLYAEDLKTASLLTSRGDMASEITDQFPVLQIAGDPFLEEIAEATHIVLVEDARTDPRTDKKIVAQLGNRTIVNVPIILLGKRIGALGMGSFGDEGIKVPHKAQLDFLSAIAGHLAVALDRVKLLAELDQQARDQAALALENARLYDTASRRANELAVLMHLGQAISSNLDLHTVLNTTYQYVGQLMDNDSFWIATYEQGASYAKYLIKIDKGEHYPTHRFSIEDGFAGYTIRTGKPVLTDEPLAFYKRKQIKSLRYGSPESVKSLISVPLLMGNQVTGAMSTQSYKPNAYSHDELEMLVKLAQPIAIALENARLFTAERKAHDRMARLQAATQVLSTSLDLPQVLELILSELQRVIPYDSTSVQQLTGDYLEIIGGRGFPNLADLLGIKFYTKGDGNPNRVVIQTRKPLILDNAPTQYNDFHTEPHAQTGIRSWLGVPLIFGDRLIGMLALDKQEADFYTQEHARLAQAFATQAASAIVNAQLYDQLSDYAGQLEKRVEERTSELANANEQLQELDRLKSKFVSDVSHELRTPVTNLNLYLDLLERGKQEQKPRYFAVLREQAKRLKQLIEDILDLSRLDMAANIKAKMEPVELNEIINLVVATYRLRAETSGLQIEFIPLNKPAFILGEHNQLSQVITNLVINSINYTSTGHIWVKCYLHPDHNMICVEVQDTGMGIPAEDLPHIFDRFYRGQKTSQLTIPGTGLGLAIVKEIVHQHSGEIEVISEVNSGSTFRILLPVLHPNNREYRK